LVDYDKLKLLFPEVSSLFILRTLERVGYEEAIEVIKKRPNSSPICWNFHNKSWVAIDALSLSK